MTQHHAGKIIFLIFCLIALLMIPFNLWSCPCFSATEIYAAFQDKSSVHCTNNVAHDFSGNMTNRIFTVVIRNPEGYAIALLNTGANAGGMFGSFANGGCEMNMSRKVMSMAYGANPKTDHASCKQSILDACRTLNVLIK